MATHQEDSDHIEDPSDDAQLTIRIPNPKVYMARQSRWVGRRGKPRCDHCRLTNLKCDRVLPICNHCSWANYKDCTYTPLPTPAHRGIPRCDRCRTHNMKCDRNLPICNNCKECAHGSLCNYTPKKRHKQQPDREQSTPTPQAESSSSLKPSQKTIGKEREVSKTEQDDIHLGGHTFYGQNIATPTFTTSISPVHSETEYTSDPDSSHTGRFTADFVSLKTSKPPLSARLLQAPALGPSATSSTSRLEIIPHTFPVSQHKIIVSDTHIEPWKHLSFIPLPDYVLKYLQQIDSVEMPKRPQFEKVLQDFCDSMIESLRETALFSVDNYLKITRSLQSGDVSHLSERLRSWISIHRICSGSPKYSVILVPRDSIFQMDKSTAEEHRHQFVTDLLNGNTDIESLQAHHYDRVPVFNQMYDILTYAHRAHLPVTQMLLEIVRLRFTCITWPMVEMYVRMCPLCIIRNKKESHTVHQPSLEHSPSPV